MRIDKIEICNIASIEGEQQIDFTQEPLKSAGLFAITGKTGAGKSTVLDAVCLALYNEAPRLGNKTRVAKTADDASPNMYNTCNMLRRGTEQGYSRVTFSLNDGSQYVAKWAVSLNRNGKFRPVQRELEQLRPKHTVLADKNTEVQSLVEQIVRLDYSQFTRTVILAQNGFANFLSAKKGEKSQLLEKITGTEIYAKISHNIYEETRTAEREYSGARQHMEALSTGSMSEEDLQQKEESLRLHDSQLNKVRDDLERVQHQIEWMKQYKQAMADVEQIKDSLQEARHQYSQLYDSERDLERYDTLQPFAKTYSNIKNAEENINKLKEETTAKETEAEKYRRDAEVCKGRYSEANDRLLTARQTQSNQQPNINRGRLINGRLTTLKEDLKTLQGDMARSDDDLRQRMDSRNSKEAELNDTRKRLDEARLTMQTMRQHQAMVDQMEYVRTHLQMMNELRHDIKSAEADLNSYNKEISAYKDVAATEEKNNQTLQETASRLKGELLLHEQANKGLTSNYIQGRVTKLTETAMRSGNALRLWQSIARRYDIINDKADDLRRRRALHQQQAEEVKSAEIQVEKFSYAYEQLHQNYTMSQSADISSMRESLKEGTPCPLCGSTHHPYHSDSVQQLDDFLSNLAEQHQRAYDDMQAAKQNLVEKQQAYNTESGQLLVEEEGLKRMREEQAEDEKAWAQYADLDSSFAQCDENVNRDNRRTILNQIYESSCKERDAAKVRQDEFTKHQDEINKLNAEIKDVQQQITESSRKQTQIKADIQILESKAASCQGNIEKYKHSFAEETSRMESLMTITGWKERLAEAYESFDRELAEIKSKWDTANEVLRQEEGNLFRLQQELKTLDKAMEDLQRQRRDQKGRQDVKQQEINRYETDLRTLFGDSTPEAEANRLDASVKAAEEDVQKATSKYNEVRKGLDSVEGEIKSLRQQSAAQEKSLQEMRTNLDLEIARFNTGQDYTLQYFELDRYFSDPQSWRELRTTIDNHKQRVAAEEVRMEAATQTVAKLEASPNRPAEDEENLSLLSDRKELLTKQMEGDVKERNQLEYAIKAHRDSVQNMNFYRPTLEKAEKNWVAWKDLCDVLGSSDGNAFREIAQCYTFNFLVNFANEQLADLTSRYRLQAYPGTLQLEVIDRFMLDQVRAVNSLSGGETFIISLALALGLSSLSSNNLEIGSLFIDEGFGNLDNENLNMVIDALSNLPDTQHRKVGVISHTELIQSRISPKICLVPEPGGRSTIVVR